MRTVSLALVTSILILWAAAVVLPSQGIQQRSAGVQGRVTVSESAQVLPGVAITLRGSTLDGPKILQSDDAGRFEVFGLAPGLYTIEAHHNGFTRPPTSLFSVIAGQITTLQVKLRQQGAVSGQVTRMPGQGAVQALRVSYREGTKVAITVAAASIDDMGRYRLFGLDPGEYYVVALPPSTTPFDKPPNPTYFPSETDISNAISIRLRPGAEARADIVVQSTATVSVSGRTINPLPPETGRGRGYFETYYLVPQRRDAVVVEMPLRWTPNVASDITNGKFELSGVLPGRYDLYARKGTPGAQLFGHIEVDVQDRPLKDLVIPLAPGPRIEGRVSYQDQNGKGLPIPASLQVRLLGQQGLDLVISSLAVTVRSDGRFEIPDVVAGRYKLVLTGPVDITSLRQDGVSLVGTSIVVGTRPVSLEATVMTSDQQVRGSLRNWEQVSQNVDAFSRVSLVPEPPRREDLSLYRASRIDPVGNFTFSSVIPGEYRLFAWEDLAPGAEQNKKFMSRFEGRGFRVTVPSSGTPEVQVDMIPSEETQ